MNDTDEDGMPNGWERLWSEPDGTSSILVPLDPSDIYEDPDNDGYDYNHDGAVEGCDDMIAPSALDIAYASDYTPKSISQLAAGWQSLVDETIVLKGVLLVDDGEYATGWAPPMTMALDVFVASSSTSPRQDWVRVHLEARSNRPAALEQYLPLDHVGAEERCKVDVQGIVRLGEDGPFILVRGHERFTNIQEYLAGYYSGDNRVPVNARDATMYRWADPTDPDTDDDGMCDGWEAWYGARHIDTATGRVVWDVQLDLTDGTDAQLDPDKDAVETRWSFVLWLWEDRDGDGVPEPPDNHNTNDPVSIGVNIHECLNGTSPVIADTDGDSYTATPGNTDDFDEIIFQGTNPLKNDTDGDGMSDGWEVYYNLQATNPSDRLGDEDHDGLPNHLEFANGCHPRDNDTDRDIMWDGWEVEYGLDPLSPSDATLDIDIVGTEEPRPGPDGLLNWQEFLNGSSPLSVDTDEDGLGDYEEVVVGWTVVVDGVAQHYFTDPGDADTDHDDRGTDELVQYADDEDGDGNFDPGEERVDGIDNDGDSLARQNDGIDNDRDGVIDDGRLGIPAVGLPEGVDEEVDLNDYNEIFVFHTNASNPDSDLDGIIDWCEWFTDLDAEEQGLQRTSPVLSDTDGDGLTDRQETTYIELRPPIMPPLTHPLRPDSDNDGLPDGLEVLFDHEPDTPDIVNHTDPWNPDTDGDGMLDGDEFNSSDYDRDGLPTSWERTYLRYMMGPELAQDADWNGVADILEDLDGDGLTCLEEYMWRCDPLNPDTDGDGTVDRIDVRSVPRHLRPVARMPLGSDSDGDLMPDWWELLYGLDPTDPTDKWADPDRDMLVNMDEYIYDLDAFNPDTDGDTTVDLFDHEVMGNPDSFDGDGDGIAGWWEAMYPTILDPTNPLDADEDPDGDGLANIVEWSNRSRFNRPPTDPTKADTDGDRLNDGIDAHPVDAHVTRRPLNPTRGHEPLHPLRNMTRHIWPQATLDMDDDGLTNADETSLWGTDPADPDTDTDGMPDGWEAEMAAWDPKTAKRNLSPLDPNDPRDDPDWDGVNYSLQRDYEGHFIISEGDLNSDGWVDWTYESETFCNLEEYLFGEDLDRDGLNELTTNPNRFDTDGDGIQDGWEVLLSDADGDGMATFFELLYGLDPLDDAGVNGAEGDPDGDGRKNLDEFLLNTNPILPD